MQEISYQDLLDWQKAGKAYKLIDVREAFEREAYHIGGQWLPMGSLLQQAAALPQGIPLVFYCQKGIRSQLAIQRLRRIYPELNCYNLTGGIARLFA